MAGKSKSPGPRRPKSEKKASSGTPWWAKGMVAVIVPVALAAVAFHLHERYIVLPALVNTPSDLHRVLPDDQMSVSKNPAQFWGTYGSAHYFGMRTRSPKTPLVGIMWFEQPQQAVLLPRVRHWCDQQDELERYGWLEHDGRTFGVQQLIDRLVTVKTEFVKRPGGKHGGDWTARISAEPSQSIPSESVSLHSFVVYMSLGASDTDGSYLRPHLVGDKYMQHIDRIDGFTPELGQFKLKFTKPKNVVARSFLAARLEPFPDLRQLKELIISGIGVIDLKESELLHHYLGLMGYVPAGAPKTDRPNFLALQVTFSKSTEFEIVYESSSFANRPHELSGIAFDAALNHRRDAFDKKFERNFELNEKGYPDLFINMGKFALSNMLGSIGYFHGSSKVISQYNSQPVPYGPHSLYTTVPSRPFFPRGFLWDEGFHHLLLRKFDPELSLEILGSWLDLMNIEGWIPREMILGAEAEHKVPTEFIVQHNDVANPPVFFYLIGRYLNDQRLSSQYQSYFEHVYPRLKLWYSWLNNSQSGPLPGTYRWRGRNATTERELNPKTLPSGLDDYPRASHPSNEEYHLDLTVWMTESSRVMARLADFVNQKEDAVAFQAVADHLQKRLDELFWSDKTGRYCDFGLHTRHVKLVKPPNRVGPDGVPRPPPNPDMQRQVMREPKARLVSDTFGYVSLFPFFLRLIPADSAKLGRILEQLTDSDLLWSPFGLRSLAKTSPLYNERNTEHDPPYWRGSIWINMNYLALASLHHYTTVDGPHRETAYKVYGDLRGALVQNIAREFQRTGYLWEHYNDETGRGEGSHPFTGWTSLVLLIMSEQYD